MSTVAEIIQRVRVKLARNQEMPGNNCLIYFDSLVANEDVYDGNVMVARVGNERGPWKAKIYLRLAMECTAVNADEALNELERIITTWIKKEMQP